MSDEVKVEVKDEVKPEHDAAYYQQQFEQEQGNARRAKEQAEFVLAEKTTLSTQLEDVKQQLQDIKDAKANQEAYVKLDTDLVDPGVAQNLQKLQEQLEAQQKALNEQSKKITLYETNEQAKQAKVAKEQTIEKICVDLDEDFGAKYRTEARKLADSWVDDGKEKQPSDWFDAFRLMRKAYKTVSKKTKPETKKAEPTDKGVGGDASFDSDAVGTGSRNQVLKNLRKTWKGSKIAELT